MRAARAAALGDLLSLLLLQLDFESRHVAHPSSGPGTSACATSDPNPQPCSRRRGRAERVAFGAVTSWRAWTSRRALDFAAAPADVYAMMTDSAYLEQVCVASEAMSHHVAVSGPVTTTSRTLPAPDSAARFTGSKLTVNRRDPLGSAGGGRLANCRADHDGHRAAGQSERSAPARPGWSRQHGGTGRRTEGGHSAAGQEARNRPPLRRPRRLRHTTPPADERPKGQERQRAERVGADPVPDRRRVRPGG